MSTYMLILVCLSVITHHATSRMINTIADIDTNEDIESRGEMIHCVSLGVVAGILVPAYSALQF